MNRKSHADRVAERDSAQKEGFLREVDEALREDEMLSAFQRYAAPVGAVVIAGLLALGISLWWINHQADLRAAQAEQIVLALDKVDSGQQDAAFAQLVPVAQSGTDGNRSAARLLQAGIASRTGRIDQAVQLFAQVAHDDHAPKPFRDLATVREVALTFDKLAPAAVVARLRPLAIPGAPFFGSAGEMLGIAYLKQGRQDLAAPLFGAMSLDPNVPDTLRSRARQLAGELGFDAIPDVTNPPAGDAGPAVPTPTPAGAASGANSPAAPPAKP